MEIALKYSVIHNRKQYNKYCKILETLVFSNRKTMAIHQEIELLTVLIEKYDAERNPLFQMDPSTLLRSFLAERNAMSQKELAQKLAVSEGYVSDLVNGKKNISKQMAIKLSALFMVRPEAFYTPFQGLVDRLSITKKDLTH